jgi:hypothetical protein
VLVEGRRRRVADGAYSLSNVVDYDGAVCVAVVHGGQGLVALLTCGIPDLELDGSRVIEGDCLGEESSADGGFPVVVELVLDETEDERTLPCVRCLLTVDRLLQWLRTLPTADSPVRAWSAYRV